METLLVGCLESSFIALKVPRSRTPCISTCPAPLGDVCSRLRARDPPAFVQLQSEVCCSAAGVLHADGNTRPKERPGSHGCKVCMWNCCICDQQAHHTVTGRTSVAALASAALLKPSWTLPITDRVPPGSVITMTLQRDCKYAMPIHCYKLGTMPSNDAGGIIRK